MQLIHVHGGILADLLRGSVGFVCNYQLLPAKLVSANNECWECSLSVFLRVMRANIDHRNLSTGSPLCKGSLATLRDSSDLPKVQVTTKAPRYSCSR